MRRRQRRNSLPCQHRRLMPQDSKVSFSRSRENSMTTLMVAIILILLVCHTPDRIIQVFKYAVADESWARCPHTVYYASNFANLLIVLNSSTNFVVYYVFRRRFRQILWSKLCCRRGCDDRYSYSAAAKHGGGGGGASSYSSRRSSRVTDDTTDRYLSDSPASRVLFIMDPQSNGRRAVFIELPSGEQGK